MVTEDCAARPRILQVSYACRPGEGSEPGMGWNRALHAAREFDVWVLCEESRNRPAIEAYIAKHGPITGLNFIFVAKPARQRWLETIPGGYYPGYNAWHRAAYEAAKAQHERHPFDLVHQIGYCGYREPGYCWQLPATFVWGPVGGTHNYPWRFLPQAGWRDGLPEVARSIVNTLQFRCSRRVAAALRQAVYAFAGNSTTQRHFREYHRRSVHVIPGGGIHGIGNARRFQPHDTARLLWSGRLHPLKGLPLLLRALAGMPATQRWELRVLGSGEHLSKYQRLAERLKIADRIDWRGWVPHSEVSEHNRWADALVFTSLRDTMPGVVLEALAEGTPVITLDHLGMGDAVDATCGLKVAMETPQQVAVDLRQAIVKLVADGDAWERLSRGAVERAARYTWSVQGDEINRWYRKVLGLENEEVADADEALQDREPALEQAT